MRYEGLVVQWTSARGHSSIQGALLRVLYVIVYVGLADRARNFNRKKLHSLAISVFLKIHSMVTKSIKV